MLPIAAPPIRDGWVAVDDGRIVACGAGDAPRLRRGRAAPSVGDRVAILPGLVNAHTHLELS